MQIQKGIVKYKDRNDIICTYGVTDEGLQYYFLDGGKLSNGNVVVSTSLVEAVDSTVVATHIGLIDSNGKILIPCENKTIKNILEGILLVEKAQPTSPSVLESIRLREDPASATQLVTTPATIKEKINAVMNNNGKFVFNDQFSEATLCDLNGNNLIGNESYSFMAVTNDKIYFSKNTVNADIMQFNIFPINNKVMDNNPVDNSIDVSDNLVSQDTIDNAMTTDASKETEEESSSFIPVVDEAPVDNMISNDEVNSTIANTPLGLDSEKEDSELEKEENDNTSSDVREDVIVPNVYSEEDNTKSDLDIPTYDEEVSAYNEDNNTDNDNILADVTYTISELLEINRNQQAIIDELKNEVLKLKEENEQLESKITNYKPELSDDLAKVLKDARSIIDNSNNTENSRKVA